MPQRLEEPPFVDVLQLAVDVDVAQLDAAHAHAVQRRAAHLRPAQVDGPQAGLPEADVLEPGAGEVLVPEVGHGDHARGRSGRFPSG